MKIENQVSSLKLSKRLKELGVKQESVWAWKVVVEYWGAKPKTKLVNEGGTDNEKIVNGKELHYSEKYYSAFTVVELGEKLPDYIKDIGNLDIGKNHTDHMSMNKKLVKHRTWHISYWTWETSFTRKHKDMYLKQIANPKIPLIHAKTEANARAKMLVYLLENGLIK